MMNIKNFRDLEVYQLGKKVAIGIFEISKKFPAEERYSLTDQVRRSSRSVCANIAEGWKKRRYEAAFVAKLSDAETECAETQVWIEFAYEFGYIDKATFLKIDDECEHVNAMLIRISEHAHKWTAMKSQ